MRLSIAFLGVLVISASAAAEEKSSLRPNVVLMFIDNVGYGDLGCYGNKQVRAPNIDRLASEGVRCTNFYIGSPSCTPSHVAFVVSSRICLADSVSI